MNRDAKNINIAYIGGGSKGWAWSLMKDLALEREISGTVRLYDIDFEAALINQRIGNMLTAREDVPGKWQYKVVGSLKEALTGSDFVLTSILPGTFDEMESDVHTPEKYGIYQSVGDSVGPGGLIRSLRTIPMFVEIAKAIREYAPEAWVLNYTNPMSVCVRTLYQVFPKIKAFGCCHEVFGTQKLLAIALDKIMGIKGVQRQEIRTNVLGINHFTWIDRASYRDIDLFPVYREFVQRYHETGFTDEKADKNWMNDHFSSADRVKMDLFRRYGLMAAAGDRHLAEFVPGSRYLKDPETVKKWKFSLTSVAWRKSDLQEKLKKSELLASGKEQLKVEQSGEECTLMMKALLGLGDMISNVNVPNVGQISNLPMGAVVETNTLLCRDSAAPVFAGALPIDIQHIVMRHVTNQEGILEACLKNDRRLAFEVFMNDPQMTLDPDAGYELFSTMIERTKKYCFIK
ncbi:MAG: alpha-glucosidase/alpha-galactosidase [Clostridiaceae bacterium]|nr:alpha-glucosidase/alpha-galactosidase [Clostridiaceae bacterium]